MEGFGIRAADVTSFLPPSAQPPIGGAKPKVTVPKMVTAKALSSAKGVPIKVKVTGPGKIEISGSAPARILSRSGRPVVVATGSATARRAGTVTVSLRLTALARKNRNRLKGARMTLRVRHGGRSTTKAITLR